MADRVSIKMPVKGAGRDEKVELPFVVGVMGEFGGNRPPEHRKKLSGRRFIRVAKDNFDEVLRGMTPGLSLRVPDVSADEGDELGVELSFHAMDDFAPGNVARQIPQLLSLLQQRRQLQEVAEAAARGEDPQELMKRLIAARPDLARRPEEGATDSENQPRAQD